jgi:hypothetical protein
VRRKVLALAGLAAGLPGLLAYRRMVANRLGRVDVYFEDGSFVTFVEGSSEADRLLPLARQVLTAARPS